MVAAGTFQFDVSNFDATNAVSPETAGVGSWEYDALTPHGRRRSAPARIVREDIEVKGGKRVKLQANARDVAKNFAIAGWTCRRHLDYVSSFRFQAMTGDRGLNREVQQMIEIASRPLNCDRGGRCNREKMFRILELGRVLDGDMGMLRLRDGRTQLIESDLVKDPDEKEKARTKSDVWEWVDGVQVDYAGFPRQFAVHRREGSGTSFSRTVPGSNFHLYGFFDRSAADQVRGISPIVAALNPFRDIYENIDYTLVKQKISQLFAIALTRKSEQIGLNKALPTEAEQAILDDEALEEDATTPREFDLTGGPTVLDLDDGEDVKPVESATPGVSFSTFMDVVIAVALKSLDLPYSFYNERFTNYSGSRTAWLHYERACQDRRADQIEARRRWTLWQMQRWIADGLWQLPSGMTLGDIKFAWIPRGMPWWKPSEEIVGDLKAIAGGLNNVFSVCNARDTDFYENVDNNLEAIKYAFDRGKEVMGDDFNFALNWQAVFAGSGDVDGHPEL